MSFLAVSVSALVISCIVMLYSNNKSIYETYQISNSLIRVVSTILLLGLLLSEKFMMSPCSGLVGSRSPVNGDFVYLGLL